MTAAQRENLNLIYKPEVKETPWHVLVGEMPEDIILPPTAVIMADVALQGKD